MVRRLLRGGHRVVAYNRSPGPVEEVAKEGAVGTRSIEALVEQLRPPRTIWVMVPAGPVTEQMIEQLVPQVARGDLIVDGGNSLYKDTIRRGKWLHERGLYFMDAGTSGGIWGLQIGYCLMVGGEPEAFQRIEPALKTLAPENGYLHVGPCGAGHFVKMVHNGIEYGMLQAYAEGFEIMKASQFEFDMQRIAALWNHGSVVRSWLLELAERAFEADPDLSQIRGYVEDSGEGRWTVAQAIDTDVPAPIITLSLLERFRSRQTESFSAKVIAALRKEFGGHAVHPAESIG
jgi:6-phosphogluconate dehydrogenase